MGLTLATLTLPLTLTLTLGWSGDDVGRPTQNLRAHLLVDVGRRHVQREAGDRYDHEREEPRREVGGDVLNSLLENCQEDVRRDFEFLPHVHVREPGKKRGWACRGVVLIVALPETDREQQHPADDVNRQLHGGTNTHPPLRFDVSIDDVKYVAGWT